MEHNFKHWLRQKNVEKSSFKRFRKKYVFTSRCFQNDSFASLPPQKLRPFHSSHQSGGSLDRAVRLGYLLSMRDEMKEERGENGLGSTCGRNLKL